MFYLAFSKEQYGFEQNALNQCSVLKHAQSVSLQHIMNNVFTKWTKKVYHFVSQVFAFIF